MALSVPKAPGMAQMMKEGARVSAIFDNKLKNYENSWNFSEFFRVLMRPT